MAVAVLIVIAPRTARHRRPRCGSMDKEIDFGLNLSQWETLKALGAPNPDYGRLNRLALQHLIARDLAAMLDGNPTITPFGPPVVVNASPLLLPSPSSHSPPPPRALH